MRISKPFPCAALFALILCQSALAQTLPSGGTVVSGTANIQQNGANQTVTQTSQKAIINWQNFSIGEGGSVNFVQPNSASIILNRVIGGGRSEIYGKLTANGQVFIVNPNGVYFGAGAAVDVGGLLATTLGISDSDFLAGNYVFTRGSLDTARRDVINEGVLKARDKGYVVLAGDYAANRGIVQAKLGTAALASGSKMTLDVQGDSLINFAVNEKTVAQLSGVENSGQLLADGGRAIMTAAVATELQTAVVNNTGIVRASTAEERNGEIILSADGGNTQNSGTLDASGKGAGQTGGNIKVLGNKVALTDNALLDASGDAGGGAINVGGNYQGKGPLANAQSTSVDSGVVIKADAITNGNGGNVVVWADGQTRYQGSISAQGGAQGGDGGNVEVSGKDKLDFRGNVTTLAAKGKTGHLLLDPTNIEVVQSLATTPPADTSQMTVGALETALNANNVTLSTTGAGGAAGNITIDDGNGGGVQWSSANTLHLQANNAITINSNVQGGAGSTIWLEGASASQKAGSIIGANSLMISTISGSSGGTWDLAGVGSSNTIGSWNDVNNFAASLNGGLLRFSNNKSFTVGSVSSSNASDPKTITGIAHTSGNTQLYADKNGGAITLAQNVNSGSIYIRASGGTNQTGGSIVAGELAVAGGAANLTQNGNNLGKIAASVNGSFRYKDVDRVEVGSVFSVNGITTNNQDVTITTGNSAAFTDLSQQPTASTASLVLNENINAGTGNVRLTTGTGGIYQRHDTNSSGAIPNGSITANALLVKGDNANSVTPFVLTNSANRVNTLAATANGSISFAGAGNSNSTLTIGAIDGVKGITTSSNTTVSTTTNTDGSITTSTNENNISLSVGGNLNIDQNLTASTATGTDTVSIGIGGDFTARTASGIKVTADTMGVFGDDMQGTFNITSNVQNLAAAGGKVMVIDNSAYTGTLAGIGIGASAASASGTLNGTTATVNSSDKPVGDFYLTTGGGLNIIKLNSKGQNLMLRSTSLSILLEAITADNARIMLQPLNPGSSIGISNGTEPGWTPDISYDANTLLKFSNPVSTFYFGTPSNAILNDANVPSVAKNIFTGDIHIGYDGAFNLGYRSLSAQTSSNLVAYNVGPLYNLRLAAPNLTIYKFNTFGDQIHLFSNNLSLPGNTSDYVNPYKPRITLRSLDDQTIWIGKGLADKPYEPHILPQTLVKLPDGSTIIISGSTDYPFPNGGAGHGDIHIPWDNGIVSLGNRKLILSTGHTLYTYNATPRYTQEKNGGTSGGLWQGCQDLTTCAGTNPSPYPDPTPGSGGNTGGGDGSGTGSNSDGNNGGCQGCPPANPNNNPYPPDTSTGDNGNGNGNGSNGDNANGNGNGDDGTGTNTDGGGDGGGGMGDGGDGDGKNGTGTGGDGSGNNGDGSGDGGGGTGSGGDGHGDNGNGLGDGGNGDGNNGAGAGGDGSGNNGDGSGDGGGGTGSGGDGNGDNGNGLGDNGNGDGSNGAGSGGDGSGNNGDGSGDGGAGTGSGGDGKGDNGNGLGDGGNGDGNDGAGSGGNGSGNNGDGSGDVGAGTGSGGDANGDNGDGSGNNGDGNGKGASDNGDGNGDGGAGTGSGGLSDDDGAHGNGADAGKDGGDGSGDNASDGGGSGDKGDGDGSSSDTAASPAFDISCEDVAQTRKDRQTSDRKSGKQLVEVKQQGLKLRDPCQQQPLQDNRRK